MNRKTPEEYYQMLYPLSKDGYSAEYLRLLNFFFPCRPQEVDDYYGPIYIDELMRPPPMGVLWTPVWFPKGCLAVCEYDPQEWWEYKMRDGFECDSLVEVIHERDDNPYYTVYGYWAYYTRGSGVFMNVGRSLRARNKIHAMLLMGLSIMDVAGLFKGFSYMINTNVPQKRVVELAREMFSSGTDLDKVEKLIKYVMSVPPCDDEIEKYYFADRINNTADIDGYMVLMARALGYDSVQLTVQANGNGGWHHEFVWLGMDDVVKESELTWPENNWEYITSRMYVSDPVRNLLESCGYDFKHSNSRVVTCEQQEGLKCCLNQLSGHPVPPYGNSSMFSSIMTKGKKDNETGWFVPLSVLIVVVVVIIFLVMSR